MCVREREKEGERERGGGKLNAHGNLVSLRKKGGLGEVCFLLDLENVTLSPFPPLHQSVLLSLSLSLSPITRTSNIFVMTTKSEVEKQLAYQCSDRSNPTLL